MVFTPLFIPIWIDKSMIYVGNRITVKNTYYFGSSYLETSIRRLCSKCSLLGDSGPLAQSVVVYDGDILKCQAMVCETYSDTKVP